MSTGSFLGFFSETADSGLLSMVMGADQETAIQELEMLGLLLGLKLIESSLKKCRAVFFTDSEAVRGAFLKGWSANQKCNSLLHVFFDVEEALVTSVARKSAC